MKHFIQLSNKDIDTALSHDLREEVRRCNKHISAMQARIDNLETRVFEIELVLKMYANPNNWKSINGAMVLQTFSPPWSDAKMILERLKA